MRLVNTGAIRGCKNARQKPLPGNLTSMLEFLERTDFDHATRPDWLSCSKRLQMIMEQGYWRGTTVVTADGRMSTVDWISSNCLLHLEGDTPKTLVSPMNVLPLSPQSI
jgi:hypothetical protein